MVKIVTRSYENYWQWKKEVEEKYILNFPKHTKLVKNFMSHITKLYDKHEKPFIPYQLMWYLYDKKNWVRKKNQHFWVAFIGKRGGEGKSTLAKNVLYFLDTSFNENRIALTYEQLIKIIYNTKKIENLDYPSILLDEPESKTHAMSNKGRQMKDIITRIRQLNLYVGVCANSLQEIPTFIYDRLTCIIFINDKHSAWVWDNNKDKPMCTIIDEIKNLFKKEGHAVFKNPQICSRAYLKRIGFNKNVPYTENDYLGQKNADLFGDIEGFISIPKSNDSINPLNPEIRRQEMEKKQKLIKHVNKVLPELTDAEVGKIVGLGRERTNYLKNLPMTRDAQTLKKTTENAKKKEIFPLVGEKLPNIFHNRGVKT